MPILSRRRAKRQTAQRPRCGKFPVRPFAGFLAEGDGPRFVLSAGGIGVQYNYSDAVLRCRACGDSFEWTAEDQRRRYEVYQRSSYSFPPYCPECSRAWHRKKAILAEYDALVGAARDGRDLDAKRRTLALLGELDAAGYELTGRMIYTQDVLTRQLAATARRAEDSAVPQFATRNHRPLGR